MTHPGDLTAFLRENTPDYDLMAERYPDSMPGRALSYPDLASLRRAVTASGSHFFSRSTMQYWGAKVHGLYGGRFFVISDRGLQPGDPIRYTVRWVYVDPSGERLQIGRLEPEYSTLDQAREAARTLRDLARPSQPGS